jgi:hypothetical protein
LISPQRSTAFKPAWPTETDTLNPKIFSTQRLFLNLLLPHPLSKKNDSNWVINGEMTIKGTSHPVTLHADFAGVAVDPYGQTKTGLSITGKIKRSDFGLTWSAVTEAGNIVVGDEITLHAEVQFAQQA